MPEMLQNPSISWCPIFVKYVWDGRWEDSFELVQSKPRMQHHNQIISQSI